MVFDWLVRDSTQLGRLTGGGRRFALGLTMALSLADARAAVVINEIHFDPDVKTELVEFIELHNSGTNAVELTGWTLSEAASFAFPAGTQLAARGYLVVAQSPTALQAKFGVNSLGPWTGSLANEGEKIVLRDASGSTVDAVDYQLGFPWPTVGDPPGYSIELVHPAFDNDLGGHWRASVAGNPNQSTTTLIPDHSTWRFCKGTNAPSSPITAWRGLDFDDTSWPEGGGPIGYGENNFLGKTLDDMRYNYTTVFFRRTFVITDPTLINELRMEAVYDDGFKVWINGTNVLNPNMATGEVPFDGTSGPFREDLSYNTFIIGNARSFLRAGTSIIAVQAANVSLTESSDFFFDARLLAVSGSASHGPTPGALNSVYATNLPPAIRQVDHSPNEPRSGQPVTITAKITDPQGVGSVRLRYQLVDPGSYIELTDAEYASSWTELAMTDAGVNGDALAGDSVYTAVLQGSLLTHRRLVRYRIAAADVTGLSVTVPYPDDPQPNFALFCYDGAPAWQAAVRPGFTPVLDFGTNTMQRLPAIHLLAKNSVVQDATWFSRYDGDA